MSLCYQMLQRGYYASAPTQRTFTQDSRKLDGMLCPRCRTATSYIPFTHRHTKEYKACIYCHACKQGWQVILE